MCYVPFISKWAHKFTHFMCNMFLQWCIAETCYTWKPIWCVKITWQTTQYFSALAKKRSGGKCSFICRQLSGADFVFQIHCNLQHKSYWNTELQVHMCRKRINLPNLKNKLLSTHSYTPESTITLEKIELKQYRISFMFYVKSCMILFCFFFFCNVTINY